MANKQLTVAEVLKFTQHDFLNKLQLILMNIDFDNVSEARQAVMNATEEIRHQSRLAQLGLPETAQWLVSFGWLYPAFQETLTCTCKAGTRTTDDQEVVAFLNSVFSEVEKTLDATIEYSTDIDVISTSTEWAITMTISGDGIGQRQALKPDTSFKVEETHERNLWTFTISGQ